MKSSSWKFVVPIAAMLIAQAALADDAGWYPPGCAYSNGKQPPTCSYISINPVVDLGTWQDKYVVIQGLGNFFCRESKLGIAEPPYYIGHMSSLFAIDSEFFKSHGGIDGIFTLKKPSDDMYCATSGRMEPKNPTEFAGHRFDFLESPEEALLPLEPINGNPFLEASYDPKLCGKYSDQIDVCIAGTLDILYAPEKTLCDAYGCHIIIKRKSVKENWPKNIVVRPDESYNYDELLVTPPSPSPAPAVTAPVAAPPTLPWYVRFWNFLKSLF